MHPDLDRALCERYPKIFAKRHDPTRPICRGIECEDGWYLLLDELCAQLQHETDANGAPQLVVAQVKEKFGDLRFYAPPPKSPAQEALITAASARSRRTCEICGATALAKLRASEPSRCTKHIDPERVPCEVCGAPAPKPDLDLDWALPRCDAHEYVITPEQQAAIDALWAERDRHLDWLKEPDAAAKVRAVMDDPGDLGGQVVVPHPVEHAASPGVPANGTASLKVAPQPDVERQDNKR